MLFTSLEYAIFFVIFFALYWFVFNRNLKSQNFLILIGSYVFYAWWDWRFLGLLAGTSLINFLLGIYIAKTDSDKRRRVLLLLGLVQGLGVLLFFKYFNFFIQSFVEAFSGLNIQFNIHTLSIILPIGISFYTFRAISYLIDVSNDKIKPTKDWIVFFAFFSFFPCLLSGPIDKARSFIPQLEKKRVFSYDQAMDGLRQILWGLFKKVVIANNCAAITVKLFDNYQELPASSLLLGVFLYIIEVYCDFSGYSDMAIGFSRLLGFNITKNFHYPFFAQNIAEFWQRWHISLTTWMTEYVYTPLSFIFRDLKKGGLFLSILINFIIVGLWHGANWTFILFGFLNGCYFLPLIISGTLNQKRAVSKHKYLPSPREFLNMVGTFTLVMFTSIIFRSDTISQAVRFYKRFFSASIFSIPVIPSNALNTFITILFISFMFVIEWAGRNQAYAIAKLSDNWAKPVRWAFYYCLMLAVFIFGGMQQKFIYFQF